MCFCIQASNPKNYFIVDSKDECISDAIETIFPLNTENAILMWNHICIPLSYKYDISYMIEDVLTLINSILCNDFGNMKLHWLPDTFRSDWIIMWRDGMIHINSHWESTVGNLETILNCNNSISLPIVDFLGEWKQILFLLVSSLKKSGYDENKLRGMSKLINICERIEQFGTLYKE